jgi:hypothetical protein
MWSSNVCTLHQALLSRSNEDDEIAGHVVCMRERRNVCKVVAGETEKEKPFGRPKGV